MPTSRPANESTRPPEELNFEQAMDELDELIQRIESGQAGLEESIGAYERGTGLVRRCRALLAHAELRVEELTQHLAEEEGDAGTKD